MFSYSCKCILSLILVFSICLNKVFSTPLRSYQDVLDQEDRKMLELARVMRVALSLPDNFLLGKRNAGTVDTLYNIPDLFEEGR